MDRLLNLGYHLLVTGADNDARQQIDDLLDQAAYAVEQQGQIVLAGEIDMERARAYTPSWFRDDDDVVDVSTFEGVN